jgi:hypothetical protein
MAGQLALLLMVQCRRKHAPVAAADLPQLIAWVTGAIGAAAVQHARRQQHTECAKQQGMVEQHALLLTVQ